jgi:hypothetical protein
MLVSILTGIGIFIAICISIPFAVIALMFFWPVFIAILGFIVLIVACVFEFIITLVRGRKQ